MNSMDGITNKTPVILALTIDKARGRERIVIGEEHHVRRRLEGHDSDVLYDMERPLGELLFSHEKQLDKDWNAEVIFPLKKALTSTQGRREYEVSAWEFLQEKEKSHDPICMFAAYQCRRWYGENRTVLGAEKSSNQFECRAMALTRSFKKILWGEEKNYSVDQVMERMEQYTRINGDEKDTQARVWYPGKRRNAEYLIVEDSFVPAIWYYLNHLRDWGLCFCKCDNCGRIFLAPSKHYSLCSEDCRKEKSRQNKREFDARARENKYDLDYRNAYQRMHSRLKSLRKTEGISQMRMEQVEAGLRSFCSAAVQRKKKIKTTEDYKAFVDWLFEQERNFEKLCEGRGEK